jgi:hypothetical protein
MQFGSPDELSDRVALDEATDVDEVSFSEGDVIIDVEVIDDGWVTVSLGLRLETDECIRADGGT